MITLRIVFSGRCDQAVVGLVEKLQGMGYKTQVPNPAHGVVVADEELKMVHSVDHLIGVIERMNAWHGVVQFLLTGDFYVDIPSTMVKKPESGYWVHLASYPNSKHTTICFGFDKVMESREFLSVLNYEKERLTIFLACGIIVRYTNQALGLLKTNSLSGVERKLDGINSYAAGMISNTTAIVR